MTIQAKDTVIFDVDISSWANGIAGLTCNGIDELQHVGRHVPSQDQCRHRWGRLDHLRIVWGGLSIELHDDLQFRFKGQ